jgi:DNA-binding response OmpR family regulator
LTPLDRPSTLDRMARILIVDDEPHILEVVRAYLVREGHEVMTAGDGDVALDRAWALTPDLIVLDVMLPKQSGFDVLRQLRAGGFTGAVIMLTARDDVIDRVAALEIGADDYVRHRARELVARVGAVLRRRRWAARRIPGPPFDLSSISAPGRWCGGTRSAPPGRVRPAGALAERPGRPDASNSVRYSVRIDACD